MSQKKPEGNAFTLARAILEDRTARRKILLQLAIVMLVAVIIGFWPLSGWLEAEFWRFGFYWLMVGLLTIFLVLFALYDIGKVVEEEKKGLARELKDLIEKEGEEGGD